MRRSLFALLVAAVLAACGSNDVVRRTEPVGGACAEGDLCAADGVCFEGGCRTRCTSNADCSAHLSCQSGACAPQGSGTCGNGHLDGAEGCDDGNTQAGDGCSATCFVEASHACAAEPSVCVECPAGDPAACGLTFAYNAWSEWGACSTTCGTGTHARDRACLKADGSAAACSACGGDCQASEACTDTSGCTFRYGEWSAWSACVDGHAHRTRTCSRSDGAAADCASCGGQCSDDKSCVDCAALTTNVVTCAPSAPGDKASCDSVIQQGAVRCANAGCHWAGPSQCTIGGSPSTSGCYGAYGACE